MGFRTFKREWEIEDSVELHLSRQGDGNVPVNGYQDGYVWNNRCRDLESSEEAEQGYKAGHSHPPQAPHVSAESHVLLEEALSRTWP